MRKRTAISILGMLFLFCGELAAQYSFTAIKAPFGYRSASAESVNNYGHVLLNYEGNNGFIRSGILYPRGLVHVPQDLSAIRALWGRSLNDHDEVGGRYQQTNGVIKGFLYNTAGLRSYGVPGAFVMGGGAINIYDHKVVAARDMANADRTFSLLKDTAGHSSTLEFPGVEITASEGINNTDQVVGWISYDSINARGFFYDGSSFTEIRVPDSTDTFCTGINNKGQIVGLYVNAASDRLPFLYKDKNFTLLDFGFTPADNYFIIPYGINDSGVIVGSYWPVSSDQALGFIARP